LKIGFVVLSVALLFSGCASFSEKNGSVDNREFIERQLVYLGQIGELYKQIKDIDKSLENLYPVAVVENNVYFIFDLDQSGEKYEFKMEYPAGEEIPKGLRAAYVLEFYGTNATAVIPEEMKSSAVITEDAFETAEGRAQVFHEFVHCFQWAEDEWGFKMTLAIAREALEKRDFMWEFDHPFPYTDENFISKTSELDNGYDIEKYHTEMKAVLSEKDFEYMIWQEWKEGYARYIENLIRERWGLDKISRPLTPPLERPVFYETGSRYIEALIQSDIGLRGDIGALFHRMLNGAAGEALEYEYIE
jgi:hypothetical protein